MTRSMFRALNELTSYVVVNKLLGKTTTANYSKSAHAKKVLYYYHFI